MIRHGIITKLWATILVLVMIVLLFLTILLLQFFQNNSVDATQQQMIRIAEKAAQKINRQGAGKETLTSVADMADVYSAGSALVTDKRYWRSSTKDSLKMIGRGFFTADAVLKQADQKQVKKEGNFSISSPGQPQTRRLIVVGVPVRAASGEAGAIYVYQPLKVSQQALQASEKLIGISVGIAIILTTFFAFFLSTRIGAPLRRMRTAALQVAKGNFAINVPVITRDEVGDLAVAFNKMRTDLKNNITALNQEKEQLAGILNNMADGVLLLDKNGTIAAGNPPAERFIQAWTYEHVGGPDVPQILSEMLAAAPKQKKQVVRELTAQGRFWVLIMTPLFDAERKIRGAVFVLRDMTEERHIDQMKKGFVANVSHELRTPITMIQGYSEAIVDEIAQTDQEKEDMAQIILDESKRLGRLVSELLDLAKLEAGRFQLDRKAIPLFPFFHRVIKKFTNLAEKSGIRLVTRLDFDADLRFSIDPDRMEQVLTNLIDNALRHTHEGGSVTLQAAVAKDKLQVAVRDTGVGISEEDLPFVFERFYKADKARTRGQAGTGLGLAIAKHIVEAHGGEISVNSRKGKGTTFRFSIPAHAGDK
ncbi:MAG: ATP-binding protein [Sporolactobacillus sp.]|jgi:two-component system sensor histidine kinase ResE|nr:ATP-binding protein [Sporolactobacillus sp.]